MAWRTDADGDLLALVVARKDGRVAGQNGRLRRAKDEAHRDEPLAVLEETEAEGENSEDDDRDWDDAEAIFADDDPGRHVTATQNHSESALIFCAVNGVHDQLTREWWQHTAVSGG